MNQLLDPAPGDLTPTVGAKGPCLLIPGLVTLPLHYADMP